MPFRPSVEIQGWRLRTDGRPTTAEQINVQSTFRDQGFCDILSNIVSCLTMFLMQRDRSLTRFPQVNTACDRFRSHAWSCAQLGIHTWSTPNGPTNHGIIPLFKYFTDQHHNLPTSMSELSDVFGCGLFHVMNNATPSEAS